MGLTLFIDTGVNSLSHPHGVNESEDKLVINRRKSAAALLRTVALMLEQGRDVEKIRDHYGNVVGHYSLLHD
jgi:hypothetical protein